MTQTQLSPAEQVHMKRVVLGDVLNLRNCPKPYDVKVEILLPFFAVFDQEEIDPTDKRDRVDPEDKRDVPEKRRIPIHSSELRRIQVPYVRAINPDASMKMTTCPLGSGVPIPYPLDRLVRELADTGDRDGSLPAGANLRFKLFGQAH